jgi:predicted HTH transcriptional regulator
MFANAEGGILLIGVDEKRDAQGQPTGTPDPAIPLGVDGSASRIAFAMRDTPTSLSAANGTALNGYSRD